MLQMEYDFPEGVTAGFDNGNLVVKGPEGEIERRMVYPNIEAKVEGSKLSINSEKDNKKIKAVMGTWKALAGGMTTGVTKAWKVDLKLVYSHFPVKLKQDGRKLVVENFLGEREKREIIMPDGVKLEVKGNDLTVSGVDKEKVGQSAALIEQKVCAKGFDRRVFQDGIYKVGDIAPKVSE